MTRDDAIEKYRNVYVGSGLGCAGRAIDALRALGLLKFDEAKDEECWQLKPRIVDALKGAYVGASIRQPLEEGDVHFIIGWLENAGLKIVEKWPAWERDSA